MTQVEVGWRCLHANPLPKVEPGMSNYDHKVEPGLAEALADGQHMGDYPGWEFHAYVYLAGEGLYVADVHRYWEHRDFVEAPTLGELMHNVCEKWGYE